MSFEVQCRQCTQRFAAAEHLAGKQVKCPGCGGAISIPLSAGQGLGNGLTADYAPAFGASATTAQSAASNYEVQCGQCAKRFAASAHLAGKSVRCPGCGGALSIPLTPNAGGPGAGGPGAGNVLMGVAVPDPYAPSSLPPISNAGNPFQASLGSPAGFGAPGGQPQGGSSSADDARWRPPTDDARWQPTTDEPAGLGQFLASHKMMVAVACGALLMFGILAAIGQWIPGFLLAMVGGGVALCGFLPQATAQQRAAANARRTQGKNAGSSSGIGGKAAAGGGGAVFFALMIILRVAGRAARHVDGGGAAGSIVATVLGLVAIFSVLGLLIFAYIKLGRHLGFYPVTAGAYLGFAALFTIVVPLISMPGLDDVVEPAFADASGQPASGAEVALFNVSTNLPNFPNIVGRRVVAPGVEMAVVRLPATGSGHPKQLYVYTPTGSHPDHSLPCVLIAPAGAPVMVGMDLGQADQPEHIPYVQQGFAVVSYEVEGHLENTDSPTNADVRSAYNGYRDSCAGLVNARTALEFVLAKMPEVDPERIYTAGHSSAGRQALLLACHEPRVKGCVSYAGVCNVLVSARPYLSELKSLLPGVETFLRQSSPSAHASHFNCPVFLFHAHDDSNVPISQSQNFAAQLKQAGKDVSLETVATGDHYDSMINPGISRGIAFLKRIDSRQSPKASDLGATDSDASPADSPPTVADGSKDSAAKVPDGTAPATPSAPSGGPPTPNPVPSQPPSATPEPYVRQPSVPQPNFPQPSFPQSNVPQPSFPQPSFPQPGVPNGGFRPPNFPRPNFPGPGGPGPNFRAPNIPGPGGPGRPGGGSRPAAGRPGNGPATPATTPPAGSSAGRPVDIESVLADLKTGEYSKVILAVGKLPSIEEPTDEQRQQIAEALVTLLESDNLNISITSSTALSKWATPDQVPRLAAALDTVNPLSRGQILQALEAMQDPAAAEVLAERLTNPRDRGLVGSRLSGMGELAEVAVLKYADSDDADVRRQVLNVLRRVGTERCIPTVRKISESDPDQGVRLAAESVLRSIERKR